MKKVRLYESFHGIDEARHSEIHKAAKQGSYPVTIVITNKGGSFDGKVAHQETVDTPAAVPAAMKVLYKKYATWGHTFAIEDATGKILFQESLEVDEAYDGNMSDFKYEFTQVFADVTGNPEKAIKKIKKAGKGFEVRTSAYMSQDEMEAVGDAMGMVLVDYDKNSNMAISVFESVVTEGKHDEMLDKVADAVKDASNFMNVGIALKKAGIKYDFSTGMMPMYKLQKYPIAIVNKKYVDKGDREVGDIAIGILESVSSNETNEKMVSAKRGQNYYKLYRNTPIKYISGKSGMGLKVPGVLLHNEYDTINGQEGAYIIDYFGAHFYVDMENKFALKIVDPHDRKQDKDLVKNMGRAAIAPEHSDWKDFLNESVNESDAWEDLKDMIETLDDKQYKKYAKQQGFDPKRKNAESMWSWVDSLSGKDAWEAQREIEKEILESEGVNEGRSINKIKKEYDKVISDMADKVKSWKDCKASGDAKGEAACLADLKDLTAKKKALMAELDDAVGIKDIDAELAESVNESIKFGSYYFPKTAQDIEKILPEGGWKIGETKYAVICHNTVQMGKNIMYLKSDNSKIGQNFEAHILSIHNTEEEAFEAYKNAVKYDEGMTASCVSYAYGTLKSKGANYPFDEIGGERRRIK